MFCLVIALAYCRSTNMDRISVKLAFTAVDSITAVLGRLSLID